MTIYGILCGFTDFTNIADFMKLKEDYFAELLNLKNGTPSHDYLSDILARIDSKKFMGIFIEWIKEIIVSNILGQIDREENLFYFTSDCHIKLTFKFFHVILKK